MDRFSEVTPPKSEIWEVGFPVYLVQEEFVFPLRLSHSLDQKEELFALGEGLD
ncbi:MAG: hypothetical protein BTN85_0313 [Candidatus Methanohalarchaeum thermophilum]|uniref:Uncharacterized protein n=1 Tax=Methanohalarchaeum thermophilum TaxID=1903181 RepID=A0A1Q6DU30_METT1|nr:MAG: hypothetical protein BTN85_0313 [Candidatus Methanohalarchaeum thermophilum]